MFKNNKKIFYIAIISLIVFIFIYIFYFKKEEVEIISDEERIENSVNENNTKEEKIKENNKIIVYITGSVNKEGIIELDEGSRITDAIEKAEGLKENADISSINLAYILSDGIKIYIPNIEEKNQNNLLKENDQTQNYIKQESGVSTINNQENNNKLNEKININNADIKTLENLPGIGESTARKIIDYREKNGKYNSIEELQKVNGIGKNKYEKIKDLIVIK